MNRRHLSRYSLVFSVIVILPFILGSWAPEPEPVAEKGILNLRDWDLADDGRIRVSGEWEFYREEFLVAGDPDENPVEHGVPKSYVEVPGPWNRQGVEGEPKSGQGYGSYRLKVLLPSSMDSSIKPSLRLKGIRTAHDLFINGHWYAGAGNVGRNREDSVPRYSTYVVTPDLNGSSMDIIVHVANFHHRKGGMFDHVLLGTEYELRRVQDHTHTTEIFILSSVVIMGFYHIALWFLGRRDKAGLYFGVFCLLMAIRTMATGNQYAYSLLPGVSWEIIHKAEYLGFYIGTPVFLLYLRAVFPKIFFKWVGRIAVYIAAVFAFVVLIFPTRIYSYSLEAYQIFTVFSGSYAVWVLAVGIRKKFEGSVTLLVGFLILFFCVINDILHANRVIYTSFVLPWGMLTFMLVQAWLLARRSSRLFATIEKQAAAQARLNDQLLEVHEKFTVSRLGTILGLAKLAEYRDEDTGYHLERIREYCRLLADRLSEHPEFVGYITAEYIDDLYQSSILHDIGKVWVRDNILLKPGPLTPEEFAVIKSHTTKGGDILQDIEHQIATPSYLSLGKQIAYSHHEKWDGTGYPQGLVGEEIPLSARIVAVADVYDALTSKRPYKDAFSHEKAAAIIREGRGSHFAPELVDVFVELAHEIDRVRMEHREISA